MPYEKMKPTGKYYSSITGKQLTKRQYTRRKRTVNALGYAVKGATVAFKVARMVNSERKFFDVDNTSGTNFNNTGALEQLANPTQGVGRSQRTGDSVKAWGITLRGILTANASETNTHCRIMIIKGNKENGTTPTLSSILQTVDVLSPKDHDNRFDTKVLYDKTFSFSNTTKLTKDLNIYLKLGHHINWSNASTTEEDGGIYIAMLSNVSSANVPSLQYYSRMTYVDN